MPIHLSADPQACALGAAMCAAVHTGLHSNLDAAARAMVRIHRVVEPNRANKQAYDDLFQKYLATYESLKELMHS
jgi:L-ribulokinase